jgi:acetolactate synthase-1/2/3 large subunit
MCTPEQKYFHESYTINEKRKLVHRPIEDLSPFLPRKIIEQEMIIEMMEE